MSQIIKKSMLFPALLLLSLLIFAGCGDTNSQSNFDSNTGKHPAGWLPDGHMTAAKAGIEDCSQCHGADYSGGISKVACTDCHIGNQQSIHPASWGALAYILHAPYVKTNGNSECANAVCHGTKLDGAGGSGPSCTLCHIGGVNSYHPVAWGNYDYALHGAYAKQNGTAGCANAKCHGAALDGVGGTGPSCTKCHMGGVTSMHPTQWNGDALAHKTKAGFSNYDSCKNAACHGADLGGVTLSGPSCYSCHLILPTL